MFSMPTIDFVSFCVSADNLSSLQSNVDAILWVPVPTTISQVTYFLGMTAYYMQFLREHSSIAALLRQQLKQDAPWSWTPVFQAAFEELKHLLTIPPSLAHFHLNYPIIATCDASAVAIGTSLTCSMMVWKGPQHSPLVLSALQICARW